MPRPGLVFAVPVATVGILHRLHDEQTTRLGLGTLSLSLLLKQTAAPDLTSSYMYVSQGHREVVLKYVSEVLEITHGSRALPTQTSET